jgi:hypothetical protein
MPATSLKQKKFMDAAAHNPAFAQQAGVPQSVAQDFSEASKGMKFGKGPTSRADLQRINKPETRQGKMELFKKGGNTMATKGVNPFAKFEKSGKDVEKKGVKEGSKADMAMDKMQMMKKGGAPKKMASGGLAAGHKSADGIASKGKTKGKDIMMKRGGKA